MHRPAEAVPLRLRDHVEPARSPYESREDIRREVLAGLMLEPPSLPCKLLYDAEGSRLFELITELPEYYQTRTELAILEARALELRRRIGRAVELIEYGSGSSRKTRLLLDTLGVEKYLPIDISRWSLERAASRLRREYPHVSIEPIVADYTRRLALPPAADPGSRLGFFPGGTIGNFTPYEAVEFLSRLAGTLGRGALLIIGVDLKKDPSALHAAYNDAAGVTASFNLNLLRRLNRELGANFKLSQWRHYAFYNPTLGRVEMHLVAMTRQVVEVGGERFLFEPGRGIHTENSYKYTAAEFAGLAAESGFEPEQSWVDAEQRFCVQLLRVK